MQYRRMGQSGLKLSELSFGSWVTFHNQIDFEKSKRLMAIAYEAGVNFFDNAEAYADGQSERIMGRALKELGWTRDTYILSSKVFWGGEKPTQRGLSKKHVRDACDAALSRFGVEYLDLYFCHRPDPETPIEETVRIMHDLVRQGKILYWGTSEWSADQIFEAHAIARKLHLTPPSMEQPEYNLLHRDRFEREYARCYSELGMGTTIWSPLASGLLTGKYNDGIPKDSRVTLPGYEWLLAKFDSDDGRQKLGKVKKLKLLADEIGISLPHLALAWTLKNPRVSTVILGASREEQLQENLRCVDHVKRLTPEVMTSIENIMQNRP